MSKILKSDKYCYVCGTIASSKEHVPARCFFPEELEYRKNLIKVYSCREHNEETSLDDEYVRNIITIFRENNAVAFKQFTEKVVKSFTRNLKLIGVGRKIQTQHGVEHAFEIDRNIFDRTIKKMGYALFYYENKFKWNRELIVLTEHLVYEDLSKDEYGQLLESVKNDLPVLPESGENPQVFKYRFLRNYENPPDSILQMTFYEGFTVWLTPVIGSTSYKF